MDEIISKFQNYINKNNIKQIIISRAIDKKNFKKLNYIDFDYNDSNLNTVFIGIYNIHDFNLIKNHSGKKWILWCGKDCEYDSSIRRNIIFKINFDFIENISLEKSHENLDKLKVNHFNLNDEKYYNYDTKYQMKKCNIFDKIKNIFIINLERRADRKKFMKFKLNDIGINKFEYFNGTDYLHDYQVNELFTNYKNTLTKNDCVGKIPFMKSTSNFAILKSYKNIFEKIIDDKYLDDDYVIIFEDDICFINDIDKKTLILDKDIIYLGSNEYNNKILSCINDKSITYGAYGICYKIKVIKIFYETYFINFINLRKPYDYLLWEFINNKNISNKIIYPNLVIPNINDSDNMKPRNIHNISKLKNWKILEYKFIDLELIYYDIYNQVINNNISLRFFKNKNIFDINYYQITKIIEEDNKSFVLLVNSKSKSEFDDFLKYLKNQTYPFWRVYYFDKYFDILVKKYNFDKKIKWIDQTCISNSNDLQVNNDNFFDDEYIIKINATKLPDNFFEDLNKLNLNKNIYTYDVSKNELN